MVLQYMRRCRLVDKPSQLDAQASNEAPKREGGGLGGANGVEGCLLTAVPLSELRSVLHSTDGDVHHETRWPGTQILVINRPKKYKRNCGHG